VTGAGRRPKVIHVTTTDMSLDLLLGPQLEAFAAAGYEVVGASAPGPYVEAIEATGVCHVALRHATRAMDPRRDVAALGDLVKVFRRERPDIVHTHNPKPGWYGRLAAGLARVPVVVNTVHGLYATPGDPLTRRAVVYALASVFSDAELVQNPEDVTVLRRLGVPRSKLTVLGNGIDLARFSPAADPGARARVRAELGLTDGEVAIGAVGRLVWEKGLRELFAAAARCAGRPRRPRCW
jgi:glycosyltransferase involved in cell wall biosynthesis